MPPSVLNVETIAFRAADTTGAALPLVLRESQVVASPEWVRGESSLPAAYVTPDASIEILATFSCTDPAMREVRVQALQQGPAEGSIGPVAPIWVAFDAAGRSEGEGTKCQVAVTNGDAVSLNQIIWQWQFERGDAWVDANRSEHEIALTLGDPGAPWTRQEPPVAGALPWWEVLRLVCLIAQGETKAEGATTQLTETAFRKWGADFFEYSEGAAVYASNVGQGPGAFDCAQFLRLLGREAVPQVVDCSDVSTIVSTFAAILGSGVRQIVLHENLRCRPIRLIGEPDTASDFTFGLHEIAFEGQPPQQGGDADAEAERTARIWDGCLEFQDREQDPLPVNIRGQAYISRLVSGAPTTFADHLHSGPSSRPIGTLPGILPAVEFDSYLKKVADANKFGAWGDPPALQRRVPRFDLRTVAIPGWTVVREPISRPAPGGLEQDPGARVSRALWRANADASAFITADAYICSSAVEARRRIVVLLGRFGRPLNRADRPPLNAHVQAEVEFTTPDGLAMIGSRWNAVLYVRRASRGERVQAAQVRAFYGSVDAALDAAAR